MATKAQRVRRIGGIVIGAVKAIFRTGKAWGATRTRAATVRRPPAVPTGAALAVGAVGGAAGVYFLDPKNGRDRRRSAGRRVATSVRVLPARVEALARRRSPKEEAEGRGDAASVQTAAGNGAPVPAKEAVGAGT
jgi:hypothetical protein